MQNGLLDIESLAEAGELIAYFGYGSLVNPATHRTPVISYAPARLRGWRRSWVARPDWYDGLPVALLSASPHERDSFLEGLLVLDHASSLPSLDERESGYRRVELDARDVESDLALPHGCPLYVYEAHNPGDHAINSAILQSYLDAVLQGYELMLGANALERFMSVTDNFDTRIVGDRSEPLYPRAVALSESQQQRIDAVTAHLRWIDTLGALTAD